jgi:hypothetical protein
MFIVMLVVPCKKTNGVVKTIELLIKEVVCLHIVPKTNVAKIISRNISSRLFAKKLIGNIREIIEKYRQ